MASPKLCQACGIEYEKITRKWLEEKQRQRDEQRPALVDHLDTFLGQVCTITDDSVGANNGLVGYLALYTAYMHWCQHTGERAYSILAFHRRMKARGFALDRGLDLIVGLKFRDDYQVA